MMLRQLGALSRATSHRPAWIWRRTVRADVGRPADSPGAARHPRGQRAGPPRQSRHRVSSRLPRGRQAHALAARPDQARVSARQSSSTSRPNSRGSAVSPARRAIWTCSSSRSRERRADAFCRRHGGADGVPGPGAAAGAPRLVEALDSDRYRRLLLGVEGVPRTAGPGRDPRPATQDGPLADVVSQRAWRLSRRIADSAETIDEHTTAGAAPRGPHRRQEAALPDRRHAGLLRRRRSRAHPRRAEEAAARARRLQRRARAGKATARMRRARWAPPAGPPASCSPSGGWPSSAVSAASACANRSSSGLARFRARRHAVGLPARVQASRCRGRVTMNVVAVYNMKGGVGKTTTAVNLSYLAAAAGQRTLLWDLDPQAASSFAFRVRPRVAGFRQEESGERPGARRRHQGDRLPQSAICCRPTSPTASSIGCSVTSASRNGVVTALLDTLGRDYRRRVPRLPGRLLAVDRRHLRRRRCDSRPDHPDRALAANGRATDQVGRPVRLADQSWRRSSAWSTAARRCIGAPASGRRPTPTFLPDKIPTPASWNRWRSGACRSPSFAARDPATRRSRRSGPSSRRGFSRSGKTAPAARDKWMHMLKAIESLIAQLDSSNGLGAGGPGRLLSIARENGAPPLEEEALKMATAT